MPPQRIAYSRYKKSNAPQLAITQIYGLAVYRCRSQFMLRGLNGIFCIAAASYAALINKSGGCYEKQNRKAVWSNAACRNNDCDKRKCYNICSGADR